MFAAFTNFSGDSLLIVIDTLITGVFLIPIFIWMNNIEFQFTVFQHWSYIRTSKNAMYALNNWFENFIVCNTLKTIYTILVFHWLGSISCYHVERSYFCHRMQYTAQAKQWISISNTGPLEKTKPACLPIFCT